MLTNDIVLNNWAQAVKLQTNQPTFSDVTAHLFQGMIQVVVGSQNYTVSELGHVAYQIKCMRIRRNVL